MRIGSWKAPERERPTGELNAVRQCNTVKPIGNSGSSRIMRTPSKEDSMTRRILAVGICVLLTANVAHAQLAETYTLPRPANCCLLNTATMLAEQLQDWNEGNAALSR